MALQDLLTVSNGIESTWPCTHGADAQVAEPTDDKTNGEEIDQVIMEALVKRAHDMARGEGVFDAVLIEVVADGDLAAPGIASVGDIQLPEVSGLEVTKWLKDDAQLKAIPVVAVTAFAMKGDEERIREGGCEAYLSKPISVGKFIETVRHFLGNA